MNKKEEMQRLDEWQRKEIVRRVTEEGTDVILAIYQVKMETRALSRQIINPVSITEEPLASNKEV